MPDEPNLLGAAGPVAGVAGVAVGRDMVFWWLLFIALDLERAVRFYRADSLYVSVDRVGVVGEVCVVYRSCQGVPLGCS